MASFCESEAHDCSLMWYLPFHLKKSDMIKKKMTHIGRYLYKGYNLWKSCVILTILTEKMALSSENLRYNVN